MITTAECKAHVEECQVLSDDPDISPRRATAVRTVYLAWVTLARAIAEYEVVIKDEGG